MLRKLRAFLADLCGVPYNLRRIREELEAIRSRLAPDDFRSKRFPLYRGDK